MPGSTTNGSCAIGVEQVDEQLAAVAGVDEPGRVDDRDAVLRGEPRARLHEAGVPLGDRDGEPGRDERALTGRELDTVAGAEVEPGVARVGARRHDRLVAHPAGSAARSGALPLRRLGDQVRREPAQLVPRQAGDDEHAVGRVLALLDRGAERVELRQPPALS